VRVSTDHQTIENQSREHLYLDQQNIDTTNPMGRLLFQITGAFAEFERSMIRQRVQAGLDGIKAKVAKNGKFVTKAGIVRSRLGRPGAAPEALEQARQMLAEGKGIVNTAKACGLDAVMGPGPDLRERWLSPGK